jgi:hypothetical protein
MDQAENHADGGRFARAIRPEKAEDFAAFHAERNIGDGEYIAERFAEMLSFEYCTHGVLTHWMMVMRRLSKKVDLSSLTNTLEHITREA